MWENVGLNLGSNKMLVLFLLFGEVKSSKLKERI